MWEIERVSLRTRGRGSERTTEVFADGEVLANALEWGVSSVGASPA
jgi:hypothetical protein